MSLSVSRDASPFDSFLNRMPAPARDALLLFVSKPSPPPKTKGHSLVMLHLTRLVRQIDRLPVIFLGQHPELLIQRAVLKLTLESIRSSSGRTSKTGSIADDDQSISGANASVEHLPASLGLVCHALGCELQECGGFASAAALFAQALELYEQANDHLQAALVEYDLGTLYVHLKEYERAVTHLWRARERLRRIHSLTDLTTIPVRSDYASPASLRRVSGQRSAPARTAAPVAFGNALGEPRLRVFALGPSLVMRSGEARPLTWQSSSAKELFLFMALRPQPWLKEQIVDELWPNRDWVSAAKMFHSNLYRVRQVTGASSVEYREGFYQVNRDPALWIDSVEFENLIRAANHTTDDLRVIELLSRAMELYRGEFLEGLYSDWVEIPRAALREKYLMALCRSAQCHARVGRIQRAVELYELVLAEDNLREDVYCALMKLYWESGEVNAACQVHRRCVEVLRKELGAAPRAETEALYAQIRAV